MSQNDLESSEAPAGVSPLIRFFIERTAVLVCEKGFEYEKKCMAKSVGNPDFSFLWSSDPNHEFYQHKISEYKHRQQQQQQNQDGGECKGDAPPDLQAQSPPKAPEFPKSRDGGISPELVDWFKGKDLLPLPPTKYIVMLPRGVTRKEVYTIKLTAQFVARHGMDFERTLMKSGNMDSRFEFMKPTDSRFSYFNRLAAAYSAEFPPGNSNTLTACTATVVEDFFRRLQSDDRSEEEMLEMEIQKRGFVKLQEELLHKEGRELALIDFSELVSKFYPEIQPRMPGEPEPKRHKFDEPALVPEDQFLAQHPGSSTIRVSVPNGQVIEITVQSLSENVASLKEKIAGEIQIPANKHKLCGKSGFLEDNNMSLAHYNVGAGKILTLSL